MKKSDYSRFATFYRNYRDMFDNDSDVSEKSITNLFWLLQPYSYEQVEKGFKGLICNHKYTECKAADIIGYIKRDGLTEEELQAKANIIFAKIDHNIAKDVTYILADARACIAFYSALHSVEFYGNCTDDETKYYQNLFVKQYCNCNPFSAYAQAILQQYLVQYPSHTPIDNVAKCVFIGDVECCNNIAHSVFGDNFTIYEKTNQPKLALTFTPSPKVEISEEEQKEIDATLQSFLDWSDEVRV